MVRTHRGEIVIAQREAALDDPHLNIDNRDRLGLRFAVYDALVRRSNGGDFEPALATSWTLASDARTWEFTIRPDVRFHDGSTLAAEVVAESLERARDPRRDGEFATQGIYQSYLADARIEPRGSNRLTIVTARPMADLLDLLVELPITGQRRDGASGLPCGTGPYRVESSSTGSVRMASFAEYWDQHVGNHTLHWMAEPDAVRRLELLHDGEAEIISGVPCPSRQAAADDERFLLTTSPSSTCVVFICNAASGPCCDPRVRRALNFALDMKAVIYAAGVDGATPISGPLTPVHFGYDPETPAYEYSPNAARALLKEAGFKDGIQLTLDIPTVMPDEAPRLARVMVSHYARVGIDARVREFHDRPGYAKIVRDKAIDDACCFDSTPLSTYRVLREKLYGGVDGPWRQGYQNPLVDALIDQAAATPVTRDRQRLYRQAYRSIRDDAPWIFLYSPLLTWASASGLSWQPSPGGFVQFTRHESESSRSRVRIGPR